jgi:hypothetical protein
MIGPGYSGDEVTKCIEGSEEIQNDAGDGEILISITISRLSWIKIWKKNF